MKTMLLYLFSLLLLCTVTAAGHHQSYETIYVHTDRCNFCAGDTVWFQVYVMDTRQQAESYSHFVYAELLHDTIRMATEKIKVGEEGFAGFFPLPDSIAPGHYTLRFYTLRSASLPIPRFHYTPITVSAHRRMQPRLATNKNTDAFHVSFFPEGGHLPTGTLTRIAFKALQADGLGANTTGYITGSTGDTIVHFRSEHLGMGSFAFEIRPGETYTAVCTHRGKVLRFALPEPKDNAVSLWANPYKKEEIIVGIKKNPAGHTPEEYTLRVESQDSVLATLPLHAGHICRLSKATLPAGVIRLTLTDRNGLPQSTRTVLNAPLNIKLNTHTEVSRKADNQCRITLTLTDPVSNALPDGNISLSVTDTRYARQDTTSNILSAYLLTPYIRGYIEQPASYFSGDATHDSFRQDLLMLTQAWTAFDTSADTANRVTNIPAETTELIQGRIISNRNANKGIPQATVTLLSFDGKIFKTTKTDPEGYFLFDHLSFVPNTHFLIQAYTAKGGTHVAVQINKEKRPRVERISMLHAHIPETESYEENIMLYDKNRPERPDSVAWELQMDNVIVTARKQRQKLSSEAARVHSDFNRAYSPAEMTLSPYASVRDFMMHIPGVQYAKDEVNVQEYYIIKRYGEEVPAMLIIDGLEVSFGEFVSFPISAVESIEVIKDVAGLVTLGRRAANGAIMLVSKTDNPTAMANKKSNFRVIVPQGCQVKQHFYVPHYPTNNESTEKEMRRKTVYWQPDIKIKKGKADIIFTAPPQATLFMVIQGISANGKLITANKIL